MIKEYNKVTDWYYIDITIVNNTNKQNVIDLATNILNKLTRYNINTKIEYNYQIKYKELSGYSLRLKFRVQSISSNTPISIFNNEMIDNFTIYPKLSSQDKLLFISKSGDMFVDWESIIVMPDNWGEGVVCRIM